MNELSGILPWTKSCFVCGENNSGGLQQRSRIENGRIIIDYDTREEDAGYRHIVHGGIAMTLLDEVMTWAAIVALKRMCVAAELTTRLKRAIEVGSSIRVEGWVVRQTSRICFTEGVITDRDGVELLRASGKYMPMSDEGVVLCEDDFVISPESIHPSEFTVRE